MPESGFVAEKKNMGLVILISLFQLMRMKVCVFPGWVMWSPVHGYTVLRALQTHCPPLHTHILGEGGARGTWTWSSWQEGLMSSIKVPTISQKGAFI